MSSLAGICTMCFVLRVARGSDDPETDPDGDPDKLITDTMKFVFVTLLFFE